MVQCYQVKPIWKLKKSWTSTNTKIMKSYVHNFYTSILLFIELTEIMVKLDFTPNGPNPTKLWGKVSFFHGKNLILHPILWIGGKQLRLSVELSKRMQQRIRVVMERRGWANFLRCRSRLEVSSKFNMVKYYDLTG